MPVPSRSARLWREPLGSRPQSPASRRLHSRVPRVACRGLSQRGRRIPAALLPAGLRDARGVLAAAGGSAPIHPQSTQEDPAPPPPLAFGALNVSSRSPGDRRGARGPFGVAGAALLPPSACNDLWSQQRHRGQAAVPTPRPFSHPLTRCLPLWNNVAHCSVVKPPEQGGSRRAGGAGQRTPVLCAGCTATCLGCQPLGSSSEAPKMSLPLAPRAGSPVGADSGPISDGHPGRSPRCGQLRWPSWCPQRRPETGTGPD